MTPADELRSAAALLRAVVEPARASYSVAPEPWHIDPYESELVVDGRGCLITEAGTKGAARWIALMSPALAEPMAAMLDTCARMAHLWAGTSGRDDAMSSEAAAALTFARAITKAAGQ